MMLPLFQRGWVGSEKKLIGGLVGGGQSSLQSTRLLISLNLTSQDSLGPSWDKWKVCFLSRTMFTHICCRQNLGLAEPRLLAFGSLACLTSGFVPSVHCQCHMVKQCNADTPVDSVVACVYCVSPDYSVTRSSKSGNSVFSELGLKSLTN